MRVPPDGEAQLLEVTGDDAGDSRRHLRSQCEPAAPSVGERVELLIGDLLTGLGLVDLGGFQQRPVVADEAKALDGLVQQAEHLLSYGHRWRQEIAGAAVRRGWQELGHGVLGFVA